MGKIIKIKESDQDECKNHVSVLNDIIDKYKLTDIVWVGVDDNGVAHYGKLIYNKNRLSIMGALDLMKDDLKKYFE